MKLFVKNTNIQELELSDNQFKLELIYEDKKQKYSGMLTIYFDGEYKDVDDSFSHEFGVKESHHKEIKNLSIESIQFDGLSEVGTDKESELVVYIDTASFFKDFEEAIEQMNIKP